MEMSETDSGLVIPMVSNEEKPTRKFGPVELQDEGQRRRAYIGLEGLWDAMGLRSPGSGITLPGDPSEELYDMHCRMWRMMAYSLLGEDGAPPEEVLT